MFLAFFAGYYSPDISHLYRNTSSLSYSQLKRLLFAIVVLPVAEKMRSDGIDVACTGIRYL